MSNRIAGEPLATQQWLFPDLAADSRPKFERIAEAIRFAIRSGDVKQGERLPGTPVLARRYGVSEATVWRAVCALEADGWVRRIDGVGTFVRKTREG